MTEQKSLALLSDLEEAGALSVTGLRLTNPNLPYDQFEALCALLGKMHEAVRFAIGDAMIHGEKLYGERAYQAFELLNLSEKGRMEYVRVAAKVPRSVRRPDLPWSSHRAVATLPPNEQRQWLQLAADNQMSHAALRDALRNGAEPKAPETCRCCGRPLDETV